MAEKPKPSGRSFSRKPEKTLMILREDVLKGAIGLADADTEAFPESSESD